MSFHASSGVLFQSRLPDLFSDSVQLVKVRRNLGGPNLDHSRAEQKLRSVHQRIQEDVTPSGTLMSIPLPFMLKHQSGHFGSACYCCVCIFFVSMFVGLCLKISALGGRKIRSYL